MRTPLRALIVEDAQDDARLLVRELERGGYELMFERVDTPAAMERALDRQAWDVVFADYTMPQFSGTDALAILRARDPDTPFIFVSGTIGEDIAVAAMKAGAHDYIIKGNLKRLVPAVERELRDARERRERKEAEAKLRATQARLQQVIGSSTAVLYATAVTTDGFSPTWVSENISQLMGYEVAEALGPDWWIDHLHPDDQAEVLAALPHLLLKGQLSAEYRFRHKDGGYRWIHDEARLVRDAEGQLLEVFGSWVDITERKSLETQLLQAQKMEAVGRLAGGVAHDFNNLLTAVIGSAELLLDQLEPEHPGREDGTEILKAATRASDLVRQLLAFSRQQVLRPRVLDLNTVVSDLNTILRRLIGEDIELRTALAQDLGAVKTDPGQLEQVIVNLVVNARDAMPRGGKLTVETANVDLSEAYPMEHASVQPGRYVMLAVSDTGIGMDANTRTRIFEPFFTTKEVGKGTGLGLATVYGIVQQSGGYIWVYSEPGHGATFKVYLPRVDERPEPPLPQPTLRGSLRGSETVLVVEDEEMVRNLARRVLEAYGYRVVVAATGPEAVGLSERQAEPIHLLVTDVVLPGIGGRELAERLAGSRRGLKVLYTSGYSDEAVVRHGILHPATAFLPKPFTPEGLARKVREVLDA